jgi:hypothetical protein
MKVHGYCLKCHKIRRVRVTLPRHGVQMGICDECEEKRRAASSAR